MDIQENLQNVEVWMRGVFIVIFGIIFYVLYFIIGLTVLLQFAITLVSGRSNQYLLEFGDGLTRYVTQVLNYLTFQTDYRPFPFNPWPGTGGPTAPELDRDG